MIRKIIISLICTFCSFLVIGNVNAEEILQFCEYTNPCISEEIIEEVITTKNIDKTIYDSYFLVIAPNNSSFKFYFYNSTNGFVVKQSSVTTTKDMTLVFNYTGEYYRYYTTTTNSDGTHKYINRLLNGELNTSASPINVMYANEKYIYYSNQDLKDVDGNIILAKNNIEPIPEEPEEEPITIINKMALFVNDIVVYFNENNISFYQILIGLFIFNFLVYVICYIVRRF